MDDTNIKVFRCSPYKSHGGHGFMKINADNLNAVLHDITFYKDVIRSNFSRISQNSAVGEVFVDKCVACIALKQSECFLISSCSNGKCLEWTIATESNSLINSLIDDLKDFECDTQLVNVSSSIKGCGLTKRQEEILRFAYNKGYFEYPKKIKIKELSKIFDISPSTMSEILRAGQRRIFSEYFTTCEGVRPL